MEEKLYLFCSLKSLIAPDVIKKSMYKIIENGQAHFRSHLVQTILDFMKPLICYLNFKKSQETILK